MNTMNTFMLCPCQLSLCVSLCVCVCVGGGGGGGGRRGGEMVTGDVLRFISHNSLHRCGGWSMGWFFTEKMDIEICKISYIIGITDCVKVGLIGLIQFSSIYLSQLTFLCANLEHFAGVLCPLSLSTPHHYFCCCCSCDIHSKSTLHMEGTIGVTKCSKCHFLKA